MIILEQITKKYFHNRVLNNLSFEIPEKSITGIIGPNGAGKSTLIRLITGFEYPDSGKIIVDNRVINGLKDTKSLISYMPEKMELYPDYFVKEFLDFFHSVYETECELLKALDLKKVYGKKIKYLSKGWHQRLKLYIALCTDKKVIVLDEPFDGFDPLQMIEIEKIIRKQNRSGKSFILSVHQLNYAEKICDYFIFLNNGKVVAKGTLDELKTEYSENINNLEELLLRVLEN